MGCPTPFLRLHAPIGSRVKPRPDGTLVPRDWSGLPFLFFSFPASLDGTDGVVVWQETGRKGRTGEREQRGPVGFFLVVPREGANDTMTGVMLSMMKSGG